MAKRRLPVYVRAGIVPIDKVVPLILDPTVSSVVLHGHKVKVSSLRLQTFAKSTECSNCGIKATHFAVESNSDWHLNLWADRGPDKTEMLMTHDHTLARGLGGADDASNVTTMCAKCNHRKSIGEYRQYCELKGLPPPGTKKAKPEPIAFVQAVIGQRIEKKSGNKFQNGEFIATVESYCTNLNDPKKRLAYVLAEGSFVSADKCKIVK